MGRTSSWIERVSDRTWKVLLFGGLASLAVGIIGVYVRGGWDRATWQGPLLLVVLGSALLLPIFLAVFAFLIQVFLVEPWRDKRRRKALKASRTGEPLGNLGSIVRILRLGDDWERTDAAEALGAGAGPKVVGALVDALRDEHDSVRLKAARSLERIADASVTHALKSALEVEPKVDGQKAMAKALVALGWEPAGERERALLYLAMEDEEKIIGLGAVAADILVAGLEDGKSARTSSSNAGRWLARIGDPRTVDPLIRLTDWGDPDVRTAAIEALGRLGETRAVEHIVGALVKPIKKKRDSYEERKLERERVAIRTALLGNADPAWRNAATRLLIRNVRFPTTYDSSASIAILREMEPEWRSSDEAQGAVRDLLEAVRAGRLTQAEAETLERLDHEGDVRGYEDEMARKGLCPYCNKKLTSSSSDEDGTWYFCEPCGWSVTR